MAEGGRGLAMVAACTNRWGYAYEGDLVLNPVWAEACWPVLVPSPGPEGYRTSSPALAPLYPYV